MHLCNKSYYFITYGYYIYILNTSIDTKFSKLKNYYGIDNNSLSSMIQFTINLYRVINFKNHRETRSLHDSYQL